MPTELSVWVDGAKARLEQAGVRIDLQDKPLVEFEPGSFCSGYFDDKDKDSVAVFVVAVGRPWEEWFPIFVHEFCHFEQWLENREWWDSLTIDDKEGLDLALEHWAGKREATLTEVVHWCMMSAEAEYDCERRVLKKIEEHGLPLDPKEYAKRANSYVTYYYAMPELRSWCNGERPYEVADIMDKMPDHMDLTSQEYWGLAHATIDLYRKHCVG